MSSTSRFTTTIQIRRPVADVFARVADPRGFPDWNSAVESVQASGQRYVMHRRLPTGPATNELEIVERQPPTAFAIRTTSGPTPFVYRYRFEPVDGGTLVTLVGEVELSGLAALAGPVAMHAVKRGVDANLATLRSILERDPTR
jgi:carbon monoxide dehydrogenase subunit G